MPKPSSTNSDKELMPSSSGNRVLRVRQSQGGIPVAIAEALEGSFFGGFLAVDLDGADAREVLLDQIAQAGQLPLLLALLAIMRPPLTRTTSSITG